MKNIKHLISTLLILTTFFSFNLVSVEAQVTYTKKTTADGLGNNRVRSIFVDGENVYLGTDGGISISTDGGATFVNRTTADGLPHNTVYSVFGNGTEVYAGTVGGFAVSTDGGVTFTSQIATDGLGSIVINDIYVVGSTCEKTIYAATDGNGLGVSTDGGQTFVTKTIADGLGADNVQKIVVIEDNWYVGTNDGMSVSSDGGQTFLHVVTAPESFHRLIRSVFIDGTTIYAGTNFGGMSVSTDGGVTYTNTTTADGLGGNAIYGIYKNGDNMYIVAAESWSGLTTSKDGGTTFQKYSTPNYKNRDLFVSGSMVYIATDSGLAMYEDSNLPSTARSRPTVAPSSPSSPSLSLDTDNATQSTTATGMHIYAVDMCGDLAGFTHSFTSTSGFASAQFYPSSNAGCQEVQILYTTGTDWTFTATNEGGCETILESDDIVVGGVPLLVFDGFTVTPEKCNNKDGALDISVTGGDTSCGDYTFSWTGPNGFTSTSQNLTGLATGYYDVTVTDCVGTSVVANQYVNRSGQGRGRGRGGCKTALEQLVLDFRLQPNPANDFVQVSFEVEEDMEDFNISLIDLAGRTLQETHIEGDGMVSLDISAVPNGMYLIQLQSNNQVIRQEKLVVVK